MSRFLSFRPIVWSIVVIVLALSPLLYGLASAGIAEMIGCTRFDEGAGAVCPDAPAWLESALGYGTVIPWAMFMTLPAGLLALVSILVAAVLRRIRRRR